MKSFEIDPRWLIRVSESGNECTSVGGWLVHLEQEEEKERLRQIKREMRMINCCFHFFSGSLAAVNLLLAVLNFYVGNYYCGGLSLFAFLFMSWVMVNDE